MNKNNRAAKSQNFATTMGVLIVLGVFGLAIGMALFVQNERSGHQHIWPFLGSMVAGQRR